MTDMEGTTVGHHKILEKLGSGGMGEVWLAEDTRLERQVALKFLPHYASQDEEEKARFFQEARAAARLKHQNIAQVYEIGEEDDRLYIVMEYVEGGSLRDRLEEAKGRSLPLDDVMRWVQQAADGLAEAHKQGIIHRDIKPDNLMLTESGQIKITDFGLARLETATRLTAAGATLGTVNYMSPEQITGREVDQRADLFSLGATFYELLTGQRAFIGADANATYYAILNQETEPLSRYRKDLPEGLESLAAKLLEKDPAIRCQAAAEISSEISRLQRDSQLEPQKVFTRVSLLERLRSVHSLTWIAWSCIAPVICIQLMPFVANFRMMTRELTFQQLIAAREGDTGPLWGHNEPHRAIIPIPFERMVVTKSKVLLRLEELKESRDVDAFIAAALLKGGNGADSELEAALRISPTDAALNALYANWRYSYSGLQDSLAQTHAERAMQLDPDNGAYALLASIGYAAIGDTLTAEQLIVRAVRAQDFSLNWSKHYGAVYRCLKALDMIRPSWQVLISEPYMYFNPIVDLTKSYSFGFGMRYEDYWNLAWKEHMEDRPERLILTEILGLRIQSDRFAPVMGWMFGYIITNLSYGDAGVFQQYDESGLPVIQVLPDDSLEMIRSRLRFSTSNVNRRLILRAPTQNPVLIAFGFGIWTYSFYLWGWIITVWSLLVFLSVAWLSNRQMDDLNMKDLQFRTKGVHFAFIWAAGIVLLALLIPNVTPLWEIVLVGIALLAFPLAFLEYLFPYSILKGRKASLKNDRATVARKEAAHRIRILIPGIICFLVIIGLVRPDEMASGIIEGWGRSSILFIALPLFVPTIFFPFVVLHVNREKGGFSILSFCRKTFLICSILVLLASLIMTVEAFPLGSLITTSIETPEPTFISGSELVF